MSKVNIETVAEVVISEVEDKEQAQKLIDLIERQARQEAEEEKANREPPVKKQFVVVVYDPAYEIKNPIRDRLVATVVQIPEDDDTATTVERVHRGAYEYNISKKGRKYPVKTVGEACEAIGPKFFKEQGIAVKNKTPVRVIITDNRIPEAEEMHEKGAAA